MLTFKEKYVMEYVYQKCQGKKSCLISPREIISFVADKYVLFPDELEKIKFMGIPVSKKIKGRPNTAMSFSHSEMP